MTAYIVKSYEKMQYPGQREVDRCKICTKICIIGEAKGGEKILPIYGDRWVSIFRYVEAFEEHGIYGPTVFLEHMLERFPFKVECVQTDSGSAFTKRLGHTQKPTPILFGARPEQ